MSEDGVTVSVAELVEYCHTQAGLLAGRVETIGAETDELLDEIDDDIADIRSRLTSHTAGAEAATASPPTARSEEAAAEIAALDELESNLEEKQALAEAKQARLSAFQDLSESYVELATELDESVDDWRDALDRVVAFEHDHDAPAYFDDRQTLLEAAARSDT